MQYQIYPKGIRFLFALNGHSKVDEIERFIVDNYLCIPKDDYMRLFQLDKLPYNFPTSKVDVLDTMEIFQPQLLRSGWKYETYNNKMFPYLEGKVFSKNSNYIKIKYSSWEVYFNVNFYYNLEDCLNVIHWVYYAIKPHHSKTIKNFMLYVSSDSNLKLYKDSLTIINNNKNKITQLHLFH